MSVCSGPQSSTVSRRGPRRRPGAEELVRRFADWQAPLADVIAETPPDQIARLQIYDRPPLARWGAGLVTLLGDAAHPMTTNLSQGACQVLEDAAVLARCLEEGDEVEPALRRYEDLRMPRTSALVRQSRRIAGLGAWRGSLRCAVRDRMFTIGLSGPGLKSHRRFVAEAP